MGFSGRKAQLWVFWFLSVCRPSKLPSKPQAFRFHTVDGNQKSGDQQLRLVVSPIIYKLLAPSQVVIAGFLNHQHYQTSRRFVQICRWGEMQLHNVQRFGKCGASIICWTPFPKYLWILGYLKPEIRNPTSCHLSNLSTPTLQLAHPSIHPRRGPPGHPSTHIDPSAFLAGFRLPPQGPALKARLFERLQKRGKVSWGSTAGGLQTGDLLPLAQNNFGSKIVLEETWNLQLCHFLMWNVALFDFLGGGKRTLVQSFSPLSDFWSSDFTPAKLLSHPLLDVSPWCWLPPIKTRGRNMEILMAWWRFS